MPTSNPILQELLEDFAASGDVQDTNRLIQFFGAKECTVLLPVRVPDKSMVQPPEFATAMDPQLGPVVHVYTMVGELPRQQGGVAVINCTVLDLMGDLLLGQDVGVVFDPHTAHAVYFRFNGPQWVVRTVHSMRAEKRIGLN